MAADPASAPRPARASLVARPLAGARPAAGRAWVWGTAALTAGTVVLVAALAPPAATPPGRALSWLLFTGSSVHVAATGWLFTARDVRAQAARHPLRCLAVPAAAIAAAGVAAALLPPATFGWLLLPYFGWQFFHYQKQNLGLAALAAAASRAPSLRAAERRALLLAGGAAAAALLTRPWLLGLQLPGLGLSGPELPRPELPGAGHVGLPGVGLSRRGLSGLGPGSGPSYAVTGWPRVTGWPGPSRHLAGLPLGALLGLVFLGAAAVFAGAVLTGVLAFARRPAAARPPGFTAMYLVALVFPAPVFVFSSPYAAIGGMTAAHGLQYLLLVGLVAAGTGGGPPRVLRLALLANIALAGGTALSAASHLHSAGPAGRLLFGAYLGTVMAHFVIDAGVWRLREPTARRVIAARVPYLLPAGTGSGPGAAVSPGQAATGIAGSAADRSFTEI